MMNYLELERAAARHFHLRQQAELDAAPLTGELRLSMWATPAYRLREDGAAAFSCDAFTCHFFRRDGESLCQLEIGRVEATADAADPAALRSLRAFPIQAMEPWPYRPDGELFAALGEYPALPAARHGASDELPAVRNLQNLFFERRLHELEPLFSKDPEASLEIGPLHVSGRLPEALAQCRAVLGAEKENAHCYLFLGVTGMPVIEVSPDGTRAESLCMTQVYQVRAAAWEADPEKWRLRRCFAVTGGEYVKEDGEWKILHLSVRKLIELPEVPYSVTGRYDRCGQSTLPWEIAQGPGRAPAAADAMEIENIIHGWAYGCRQGTLPAFVERYVKNPRGRSRMWIKSFGEKTPVLDELGAIRAKIDDMTAQYREGWYTFHAPTTPVLRLVDEGRVLATWFDCAATNLRSLAKSPEAVPYMAFVNKYTHCFEKMDGRWYLTDFKNEPMIALPDWELNMTDNIGWLAHSAIRRFPDAFQEEQR